MFKKLLRQQQQERHKRIGFNEKKKALYVRYEFWYISSQYSAKQQREMTKFKVLLRTRAHNGEFLILCHNVNVVPTCCYWTVQPHVKVEQIEIIVK